ncbi:MAG: glycosyltransferase family 39 protein [Nitrospinota bacterium]
MVPDNKKVLRKSKKGVPLLFFLGLSFFFTSYSMYGFNLWDEGALLNGGLRVLDGDMPIRDFNGYPPGRYFLASLVFLFFGEEIFPLRATVASLTALSVLLLYSSAKQVMSRPFALLSSFLYMVAPSVYYNRFFPIFLISGMYFLFRLVDGRGAGRIFSFTLSTLLALLFKFEIAVITYATGALILLLDKRKARLGVIVTGGVVGGAVALYAGKGYFLDFTTLLFQTYENWGTPFPLLQVQMTVRDAFLEVGFFDISLFYLPLFIYLLSALYLTRMVLKGGCTFQPKELKILTVLVFGLLSYGLVIWRAGFDNLVRVLPPAVFLGCFLSSVLYENAKCFFRVQGLSLSLVALFPLWYGYQMIWNHGFYSGSIGALKKEKSFLPFERARVYTNNVEKTWAVEVVSFLKKNTGPGDFVFAVPLNSVWNFLADRKNPTSYEWIIPSTMRNTNVEQEVIKELKEFPPKYIILSDLAIDGREERRFSSYAREIYNFIIQGYRLRKEVGIFLIFERANLKKEAERYRA